MRPPRAADASIPPSRERKRERPLAMRAKKEQSDNCSSLCPLRPLLHDLNLGGAAALVALGGHDHVVPLAEVEAALPLPLGEVLVGVDAAADALGAADGPVLVERRRAEDRGLVGAARLVDVVGAAVVVDGAEALRARRGVVRAVGLDDVVLDEGVGGPAVEGEVCGGSLLAVSPGGGAGE